MILKATPHLVDRGLGKSILSNLTPPLILTEICRYLEFASKMRDKAFVGKFRANNLSERLLANLNKKTDEVRIYLYALGVGCLTAVLGVNRLSALVYLSFFVVSCVKIPPYRLFPRSAVTAHSRC